MPELPEVETTIRDLRKKVLKRTFVDVWTDFPKMIKKPSTFEEFKRKIKNKKIQRIWRAGKNIIFDLSENLSLLIHQKLTGHLLYGKWQKEDEVWQAIEKGPLKDDPMNRFLHLIFWLDNDWQLALSDLRKFAKVELAGSEEIKTELETLGPDPLEISFREFKEILTRKKGKIKQVLMTQEIISGVGNIYSDEALFAARAHPFKDVSKLKEEDLKGLYQAIRKILKKAIEVQGESISDYRTPTGEKGGFDRMRKVYRREGEKCSCCGTKIKRIKLGGRSAHFCPKCQKL
ncbi:DNA-formamidopyrimidine glycosylase [Patescibacteria group bacterium]|nr:DNA-formamidopyrimidine glycosylase [Patescibacteria group bacterium]